MQYTRRNREKTLNFPRTTFYTLTLYWLNEVAPSRQAEEGKQPDATPASDLEVPQQSDDLSNVQSLRPRRLREHTRRNEEPDPQDNIFAQYFYKKQKR